ncbi:MAG TPA: class I SAM-dependent methyltransferase [Terriglobales bacterium]|nr:class I SAM-dependent methyltransferase [Terriglobales bacterium]
MTKSEPPSTEVLRPTERFSDRVADYVRYRPGYPPELLECLRRNCGLRPQWVVADVGSGTGLLAKVFLENGNRVFGVEPNAAMRAAGDEFLRGFDQFTSQEGRAEATGLPVHSVNLITAGQAFHWFDRQRTRTEFERILKPGGWVVLVWNERLTSTPFLADYEQLLHRYSPDYPKVDHRNVEEAALGEFFHPGRLRQDTFFMRQQFDWEGVRGRWLSSSYVPAAGQPGHDEMRGELKTIFSRYQQDGLVDWEYKTRVYYGRLEE